MREEEKRGKERREEEKSGNERFRFVVEVRPSVRRI